MQCCVHCPSLCSQILTKDSVTVYVSAIMWYKVKDATSAIANVDDYRSVVLSSY